MISAFELFKIGIGPSSSHTVGPMVAAAAFAERLTSDGVLGRVARVEVALFGSLAWTGKGHGTDKAVILGLSGERPRTVDPDRADALVAGVAAERQLSLAGHRLIGFDPETDILFDSKAPTPKHPNTLALRAYAADGALIAEERWCSIGGGFVAPEEDVGRPAPPEEVALPYPFRNARDLLAMAETAGLSITGLVAANERARRPAAEVDEHLDGVIDTMMACVDRGIATSGELPGGLKVKRRARAIHQALIARNARTPHEIMDWVSLYAIAVNEENAAGGRVVTAPTNGAAGVVPATLRYYRDHCPGADRAGMHTFLLAATAIGALFKMNASISGAEVGCQGEVGVACSMAAAGLCAALGGSNAQVENAAEIGMEHHLGMTCDPIGGLVQVPCIERNAFGAISAVNAASLALHGDGTHIVPLDKVIATMRETGRDMASKYKETSLGGLAVNLPEC
ncbi:L-serine dehydratase 1 [Ancylobacter novellus DSM 506]|uniref:L-serine dehydratase n=1 Tax=Ancylobacter novellus (strain ATCC 8093 / DSM 506 / JCM 20403 / CCM 1077 / IAM 12100 / NBRC 12443 / NCIMB 10456) TaxID=639283 RepID=D7A755_ANCN5|nr:L-serine ammonia-lyase [Ancylobacter novellus]ADH90286.1 L-serine dehydratase 1 [Ancylobacter novellus DSM 506]